MNDYIISLEEKNQRLHKKLRELEDNFFKCDKLFSCEEFIKANIPTINGRIYTTEVLQKIVVIHNEKSRKNGCFVINEANAPLNSFSEVEPDNIGGIALRSFLYNDTIYAYVKFLETPVGMNMINFLKCGLFCALSPMVIGSVSPNNVIEIKDALGYKFCPTPKRGA